MTCPVVSAASWDGAFVRSSLFFCTAGETNGTMGTNATVGGGTAAVVEGVVCEEGPWSCDDAPMNAGSWLLFPADDTALTFSPEIAPPTPCPAAASKVIRAIVPDPWTGPWRTAAMRMMPGLSVFDIINAPLMRLPWSICGLLSTAGS